MANLMGTAILDRDPESNKTVKQESATMQNTQKISPEQNNHIAVKPASNKTMPDVLKEKTTFNLSYSTLELLDDAWVRLRKKLKGEQRITKTLIVEKAIEIALADLESKSELSDLYTRLKS